MLCQLPAPILVVVEEYSLQGLGRLRLHLERVRCPLAPGRAATQAACLLWRACCLHLLPLILLWAWAGQSLWHIHCCSFGQPVWLAGAQARVLLLAVALALQQTSSALPV